MALHQFVCCITVLTILLWKGCHSQQPACGRAAINTRIYGGEDASPGSWPWHAFIVTYGPYGFTQCGGSLITNQWVLTAAQCISSFFSGSSYYTEVHLARYNQSGLNPNEVSQRVKDVVCHSAYTGWPYENDICLLKLSAPVNFTNYIQPICLASENSTFYTGTSSWVTGFGYTNQFTYSNILQEANVTILGNKECNCNYYWLPKNTICAGPRDGWKGSCHGDQGEPLMTKTGSVWVQSGIASYSFCGGPSIYTRVSKYQKWINDTVTGTSPGFVTFTSPGTDSDLNFTCPTPTPPPTFIYPTSFPTNSSTSFPTHSPISFPTSCPTNCPTSCPTSFTVKPDRDDSVFSGGENLIHFTHFTSLCAFVLLLHVSIGNGI